VVRTGDEVVVVYIGRASCSWCNRRGFAEQVGAIVDAVEHRASQSGLGFRTQGIALDRSISRGLRHLSKFGAFDEIAVGGSWTNEFAFRYFWNEIPGPPGTPTILVLRRSIQVPDSAVPVPLYSLDRREMLVRKVGLFEIQRWIRAGIPLPIDGTGDSTQRAEDETAG
jgi:hypothetical protein